MSALGQIPVLLDRCQTVFFTPSPFSVADRFRFVTGNYEAKKGVVMRRLKQDAEHQYYFDVGFKVYFGEASATRVEGAHRVIAETFITPVLFDRNVRIRKGDVVFDLGASIGDTALLFSRMVGAGGAVHAFEPVECGVLKKNLAVNRVQNVRACDCAVMDSCGRAEFSVSPTAAGSTAFDILREGLSPDKKVVPKITIDRYCEENAIKRLDFVKVDIEGTEELALKGADRTIRELRPKWSIDSYHTMLGVPQHDRLKEILRSYDYRIHEVPGSHIWAY